jgi:hypothetical protein
VKYDWSNLDDPPPIHGLGSFWLGVVVGAMLEAALILLFAGAFWVWW